MQTLQIRLTKELIRKAQDLVNEGLYSNKSEVLRDALRRLTFKKELKLKKERKFTILFTSDLHGNLTQYQKLFEKAYLENAEAIIIGGDIAPKDLKHRTIKDQKLFIEKKLFSVIKRFNEKNKKRNHKCSIFILLGNDDFRSNIQVLKQNEKKIGFTFLNSNQKRLHEDFKIAGYSYVPLTPFIYKDWEKLDLIKKSEIGLRGNILLEGTKIRNNKFIKIKFNPKKRNNTIEKDLMKLVKGSRRTILVTHSPPVNTRLDMIDKNIHVGSAAVRKIIEKKQPYLTLHGHIHETVGISGGFKENIKKTISMCSGNDHRGENLAIIKFNLYDPKKAVREII